MWRRLEAIPSSIWPRPCSSAEVQRRSSLKGRDKMESDGWEEAIEGVFHKGELMGWVSAEGIRRDGETGPVCL